MVDPVQDRRRGPRTTAVGGLEFMAPASLTVQLLDISPGGVLLVAPADLPVGQRGELRMVLASDPCAVQVEIRHVTPHTRGDQGEGRYRLGATFVALDDDCRRSIQRFLKNEPV